MTFEKTPGWLDWYAGPSQPKFKLPAGSVAGTLNLVVVTSEPVMMPVEFQL